MLLSQNHSSQLASYSLTNRATFRDFHDHLHNATLAEPSTTYERSKFMGMPPNHLDFMTLYQVILDLIFVCTDANGGDITFFH